MRILVTGARDWEDKDAIFRVLKEYRTGYGHIVIIHGASPGADTLADEVAGKLGYEVESYPADWVRYGKRAGYIRNRRMLRESLPDLVIAFHNNLEGKSKGTKDMVAIAKKAGVPVMGVRTRPMGVNYVKAVSQNRCYLYGC